MKIRFSSLLFLALFISASSASATIKGFDYISSKETELKPGAKGSVVIFMSAKCPCSNTHLKLVKKLAEDFKDFSFVVIHANADETDAEGKKYFQASGFSFPVIRDEKSHLADEFKAFKTPHAYLLSPEGKVLYKGGITNSANGETADKQFLREALDDTNTGKPIRNVEGRTLGCVIAR